MNVETINVPSLNVSQVNDYEKESLGLSKEVQSFFIREPEDLNTASALRKKMKDILKNVDTARKNITKPLDEAKKNVMDLFRPIETALNNNVAHVDSLVIAYTHEQELIRQEFQDELKRQAEAQKKEAEENWDDKKLAQLEKTPVPIVESFVQKVSGMSFRETWKARVVNTDLVPREYMVVNESLLNTIARETKGPSKIPGVEFYTEKVVAGR